MTGLLARVSRWLVRREPLWLVTGAGAVLDVATYVVPVVSDSWHGWVNAVVVVLTLLSGRAIVASPDTVAKLRAQIPKGFATGGTIPAGTLPLTSGGCDLTMPTNVRRVLDRPPAPPQPLPGPPTSTAPTFTSDPPAPKTGDPTA